MKNHVQQYGFAGYRVQERGQTFLASVGERLLIAFACAFVAAATLVLLPFFFASAGSALGGLLALEAAPAWYVLVFSRIGILIVALAAVCGFLVSPDRMTTIFSFVWGTHGFWSRIGRPIAEWSRSHGQRIVPLWITLIALAVLLLVAWVQTS